MAKKVLFSFEVKPGMVIAEDLLIRQDSLSCRQGSFLTKQPFPSWNIIQFLKYLLTTLRLLFLKQNRQTTIIQITLIIPRN